MQRITGSAVYLHPYPLLVPMTLFTPLIYPQYTAKDEGSSKDERKMDEG